jgi:hypothetical protein
MWTGHNRRSGGSARKLIAKTVALVLICFYLLPLAVAAGRYWYRGQYVDWRSSDQSSTGLLGDPRRQAAAAVRVFSARTVSWRGIFATHSWIVVKDENAACYQRFDYTAWGRPIGVDRFAADARWFGSIPEVVFAADGTAAANMIPRIRATIEGYRYSKVGDYRIWPGPNSNTFVAVIMQNVPEMAASLPPTAVGKDFPYDGRWLRLTPSRTGMVLNLGGYVGVTIGWIEGLELNLLGAVAGLDFRHPGLKLPGLGRIGFPVGPAYALDRPILEKNDD